MVNRKHRVRMRYFLAAGMIIAGRVAAAAEKETQSQESILQIFIQQDETLAEELTERLEKASGIALTVLAGGISPGTKLRQYLMAGIIPDVIQFQGQTQARLYLEAGLLLDLDESRELLPELYGNPDYETALNYSRSELGGDGGLYLVPSGIGSAGDMMEALPLIMQSGWKKAGKETAGQLDDYMEILNQMIRTSPLNSTGEPMFGMSLYEEKEGVFTGIAAWEAMYGYEYGAASRLMEINMKNGEIASVFSDDSMFWQVLQFYAKAYQGGLLDEDSRYQTRRSMEGKVQNGRVFLITDQALAGVYNQRMESFGFREENTDGYVVVPSLDMQICIERERPVGTNGYWAVYRYSEDTEKACELLNEIYKDESVWNADGTAETESGQDDGPALDPASEREYGCGVLAYLEQEELLLEKQTACYLLKEVPTEMERSIEKLTERLEEVSWEVIYAGNDSQAERMWEKLKQEADMLGMEEIEAFYRQEWERAKELEEEILQ